MITEQVNTDIRSAAKDSRLALINQRIAFLLGIVTIVTIVWNLSKWNTTLTGTVASQGVQIQEHTKQLGDMKVQIQAAANDTSYIRARIDAFASARRYSSGPISYPTAAPNPVIPRMLSR